MLASPEYHSACEGAALFDQSDHGQVEVAGPEAAMFLHNLCTNDIKSLAPGAGCEAFLCNSRARVLAHVFVYRLAREPSTTFWLDAGAGMGEKVRAHLDQHLISERVELADRTREHAQLHLCGPEARTVLEKALGQPLPDLADLAHTLRRGGGGEIHIRRHDLLNLPGYDLVAAPEAAPALGAALREAGATLAGPEAFAVLRVEAGFPLYGADMDENRFVVEVGRTPQAISYTKGCYLGQEPIVMARDRGHINRTLLGLILGDGPPAAPGTRVVRDGQEIGVVTSSVRSPRLGQAVALAYLRRGHWELGTAVEVETDGARHTGTVAALPLVGAAECGSL
jgi:folate-binding protein YgfZ